MLRLFFNRNSLFPKLAFWGALFTSVLFFWGDGWARLSPGQKFLWALCLFQILFAKAVDLYPWYPKDARGPGIGLQFQKAMIPVSYLWFSLILWLWFKPLTGLLILYNLLFLPMGAVACILIHFHRKDPDRQDPNGLSGAIQKPFLSTSTKPLLPKKEREAGLIS
jgi:hypothetical protein